MKGTAENASPAAISAIVAIVILAIALCYGAFRYLEVSRNLAAIRSETASTTAAYDLRIADLESSLVSEKDLNASTTAALLAERQRNDAFASQINGIKSTVDTLDKLSKTDPELLKKYSIVYFLNENYVPASLTDIDAKFIAGEGRELQILTPVWPYLKSLLEHAEDASSSLEITSAYRSFGSQASLKSNYTVVYGSGANRFSADQGYSEHQLGTTVDFTTLALSGGLTGFEKTPQYKWLLDNAYKYGFILSYPPDNQYYEYEPWHWRFVGVDLATELHNDHQNFYDIDQRVIDGYLVSIFD